jgi:hypothetical protein
MIYDFMRIIYLLQIVYDVITNISFDINIGRYTYWSIPICIIILLYVLFAYFRFLVTHRTISSSCKIFYCPCSADCCYGKIVFHHFPTLSATVAASPPQQSFPRGHAVNAHSRLPWQHDFRPLAAAVAAGPSWH